MKESSPSVEKITEVVAKVVQRISPETKNKRINVKQLLRDMVGDIEFLVRMIEAGYGESIAIALAKIFDQQLLRFPDPLQT
jgi:acetyl-CoA carboxylase carboxyltransferase component